MFFCSIFVAPIEINYLLAEFKNTRNIIMKKIHLSIIFMILKVIKLLKYLSIYILNAVFIIFFEIHKLCIVCKLSSTIHSLYLSILRIHNLYYVMLDVKSIQQYHERDFLNDKSYNIRYVKLRQIRLENLRIGHWTS